MTIESRQQACRKPVFTYAVGIIDIDGFDEFGENESVSRTGHNPKGETLHGTQQCPSRRLFYWH